MTTSGRIAMFGGEQTISDPPFPEGPLTDTWTFDGATWTQMNPAIASPAAINPGAATFGSEMITFGGWNWTVDGFPDTTAFDGSDWVLMVPAESPSGRTEHAMAALGSTVVLFGGSDLNAQGTALGDTWTFDGFSWTRVTTATSPSARVNAAVTTLGSAVIVFGGADASGLTNDTWKFDGTSWSRVTTVHSPAARRGAAMATRDGEVYLFGGYKYVNDAPVLLDDTWRFDGSDWTELSPASSPTARFGHAMAELNGTIVLFGGVNTTALVTSVSQYDGDTWTFDGSTWTQLDPAVVPPPRAEHAMTAIP